MDPNAALALIRDVIELEESGDDVGADTSLGRFDELMEAFRGLDGWLSRGGFLPSEWAFAAPAAPTAAAPRFPSRESR